MGTRTRKKATGGTRTKKKALSKANKATGGMGGTRGTGKKRKLSEKEGKEEGKEEKEKEMDECGWVMPFPMHITKPKDEQENALVLVDSWHASLAAKKNELAVSPNLLFEFMVCPEKNYESATKALQRRVAVLGKLATLAKSGGGSDPSCSLAFMCRDHTQMVIISSVLLGAGYSIDPFLVGNRRGATSETVYVVVTKTGGRRRGNMKTHWEAIFPNSTPTSFQYNEKLSYLTLAEQTATWFLACNAGSKDVVWQFNASQFTFFSEAAIAMRLRWQILYDDDASDCNKMRKVVKLARAYVAQQDSFRLYSKAQVAP